MLFALVCTFCSGGRDLSNNRRTNKDQSSDQKFEKMNEALRVSCRKGYPVRVVRYVEIISFSVRLSVHCACVTRSLLHV